MARILHNSIGQVARLEKMISRAECPCHDTAALTAERQPNASRTPTRQVVDCGGFLGGEIA
jgi:hypothetical protein